MNKAVLAEFCLRGLEGLYEDDPELAELLGREYERQAHTLAMVAASSIADPSVLVCEGLLAANVTTEGYPGARFHAGCEVVDQIERLAIERAKAAFGARYANVQPHSGSSANQVVLFSLLRPGDTVLGMDLDAGGHLTHGSKASVSGQYFRSVGYGVNGDGLLDYDQVERLAKEHRPKLIIAGASSYPRAVDFARFRQIADSVGAFLLADISHIAGLVAAGQHQSPVDHAHFTTTSTYKQLYGPRGGLILMGRDFDRPAPDGRRTLAEMLQKGVFPFFQGTPNLAAVAAKARALALVASPSFRALAGRIVGCARSLAACFLEQGYRVLAGGTDNHMVLIDVWSSGVTGVVAERALEACDIVVNKNKIPGDRKPALVTSGMRLGTNSLAARGMTAAQMPACAELIHRVLEAVRLWGETEYELSPHVRDLIRGRVRKLCEEFPLPNYPVDLPDAEPAGRQPEPSLA